MTNTSAILQDLQAAFYDIPFENSDFQNKVFVEAAQITPARAYRAIGLKMFTKLRAVEELDFARQREEIDIEEWQAIIDNPATSSFDKRRAQIDINQRLSQRDYANKLLNDAIHELNVLYGEFKRYPRYTREQFEAEELEHFNLLLANQLENAQKAPNAVGTLDSIKSMHHADVLAAKIEVVKRLNDG